MASNVLLNIRQNSLVKKAERCRIATRCDKGAEDGQCAKAARAGETPSNMEPA
jgi:hypothetical protein